MKCYEIKKRLNAWVDNEVPLHEAEKIILHLTQCPDCHLEAQRVKQMADALDAMPSIHAPNTLSPKIIDAFRLNFKNQGILEWWQSLTLTMQGAFCGAALAGLIVGVVLGSSISTIGSYNHINLYQLYASQGVLP